jgi:Tfp pilus assembly protein PilF
LAILDTAGLGEHPKAAAVLTDYAAFLRKIGRPAQADAMQGRAEAIRARLVSAGSGGL